MERLLLVLPLFLFSLTVHEYAHAWAALRFGDSTARDEGRLTLDPRSHIDPFGLLMFFLSAMVGFGFGWARPVPVQLGRCPDPLKAMLWIAAAGPLSNLLQAVVAVLLLLALGFAGAHAGYAVVGGIQPILDQPGLGLLDIVAAVVGAYLQINLVLMLFNLVPIPPLDGGRILVSTAPYRLAAFVASLERYGFLILLLGCRLVTTWVAIPLGAILMSLVSLFAALGIT
ncbi:MAG: site-2 protease family protein [Armatimonadetes bacterium]|nr:site-2 protease family protein [Armatimonadota bacterium]